jgi:hypothetical protein
MALVTIVMLIERLFACPTHIYGLDPSLRMICDQRGCRGEMPVYGDHI